MNNIGSIGGAVGLAEGSDGAATVSGTGSIWTNAGDLTVGSLGMGNLRIEDGGVTTSNNGILGYDAASIGTATVTGSDAGNNVSTWNNSGNLTVAKFSQEFDGQRTELRIEGGGLVMSDNGLIGDEIDSNGLVTINGKDGADNRSTWSNALDLKVGNNGTGTLLVENDGVASINGELTIADFGVGTLTIDSGGTAFNGSGTIGANMNSHGTVTVTGDDGAGNYSTWANGANLFVGLAGTGTLMVENGGKVSNTNGSIGSLADSTGHVYVTGGEANWSNAGDLTVGDGGTATLMIDTSGAVSDISGWIGRNAGSDGTVMVADATWTNSMALVVGNDDMAKGMLTVQPGGMVSNDQGTIGYDLGSDGMVTVTGDGAVWNNSGNLTVAKSSQQAKLRIEAGGHVFSADGTIGTEANSIGIATVTGAALRGPTLASCASVTQAWVRWTSRTAVSL